MTGTDVFIFLYRYLTESYGSGQDIDDRIVEGIEFSFIALKVPVCVLFFKFEMLINSNKMKSGMGILSDFLGQFTLSSPQS